MRNYASAIVLSTKTRSIHYEDVPADPQSSFTLREFNWPAFPFNWHYHPEVELTLIVRGRGIRFVGDSAEEFADGDLCLLGANTPHCWASHKDAEPGVRSLVVQFRPDVWGEALGRLPEFQGIAKLLLAARRGLDLRGAARREVEQMFLVLQQQVPGSLQRLDTLLEILHCIAQSADVRPLAAAACEPAAETGANSKLGKILGYIHGHLGPELTQHEVAEAVRLSPAAFSQFFRRSLGTSYVHYVNELKIRNACRALLDTNQTVTEIAYHTGFNNLSHFNAQFRRFRQLAPREFRRQAQAVERSDAPTGANGPAHSAADRLRVSVERDVTLHGKGTHFEGVRVRTEEPRPWLMGYEVCPALAEFGIVHAGIAETHAPYQIVRTNQTTSYFLACFGGRGQVLVDGRWRNIRPGLACLLPAHLHNAFEAQAGEPWHFAYVCYQKQPDQSTQGSASSPVVTEFAPEPLRLAILGLTAECRRGAGPAQVGHWLHLVQGYVQGFTRPSSERSPLPGLWQRVETRLGEPWSLEALARAADCSSENLRRLCFRELGRNPLQHLVSLRMRRATELLATTDLRLGEVAQAVGYPNVLLFSNLFKSNVGCRPSEYRQRAASQE